MCGSWKKEGIISLKLLAANEEILLKEGDEVQIAEEKYFWK